MFWTLLAMALWVVLGGFISYYGDLQGRRWGKRRVSWFGLRPKHTAILITSLTGGFIALLSVLSLMIIAPAVRDVILRGESAIQENQKLIAGEKKQRQLEKQRRDLEAEQNRQKQAASDATLAETKRDVANLQRQRDALISRVQPLQNRVDKQLAKIASLQVQAKTGETTLREIRSEQSNFTAINIALGQQNEKYSSDKIALEKEKHALELTNQSLENTRLMLTTGIENMRKTNDAFYNEILGLRKEKTSLDTQIAELTHDREEALDLIRQRDALNSQIETLNHDIVQKYSVMRQSPITLRAGVELGRLSMDAHLRPQAIRRQLSTLLTSASEEASKYGAKPDESGSSARLLPQKRVTVTGDEERGESQQLDDLANDWAGQDESFVVVATTAGNCLAGEPAYVALRPYKVTRVFTKGQEVASRVIDGHSKVDAIIDNLIAFLQKDVKEAAIHAGTIPRVDPDTDSMEVGVLDTAELFSVTDRIRRMRGPVLLTARAKHDLSSADSLNLTFHVRRLPQPPQTVAEH